MPMKKFINAPEDLTPELLEGFALAFGHKIAVDGKTVVRAKPKSGDKGSREFGIPPIFNTAGRVAAKTINADASIRFTHIRVVAELVKTAERIPKKKPPKRTNQVPVESLSGRLPHSVGIDDVSSVVEIRCSLPVLNR